MSRLVRSFLFGLASVIAVCLVACDENRKSLKTMGHSRAEHEQLLAKTEKLIPMPPWPPGDERGMTNSIGNGTWMRCAHHLANPRSKVYELSHVRSNNMSMSPWSPRISYEYRSTQGLPGYVDAWHPGVLVRGEPGAQGTQMDALGHWGTLDSIWSGEGDFPAAGASYYGGFTQNEVKPSPTAPLARLGIDKVPPIITSALLLDARASVGGGKPLAEGFYIEPHHIDEMIATQGLTWRGIQPGDVVYIYTGWSDSWGDDSYYQAGPGLSYESAVYLAEKGIVLVALDNPFTDAVHPDPARRKPLPPEAPETHTPVHYYNLVKAGVHNIQNANLKALAADKVWLSCTIILPLLLEGGTGSPVRPIAIGVPLALKRFTDKLN